MKRRKLVRTKFKEVKKGLKGEQQKKKYQGKQLTLFLTAI